MSTAQKQPDSNIGRSILNGQFLIEQKIGSGGMGAVYRASQPAMNRQVAVKILHPKLTNRKDLASRFRREARAMSHLTHPNTAKVFLYGELEDGSLYIVMEYLEGKNLNQVVRREGPLPLERAIPVLVQVCGALQEAHSQGIIHRDLKPENIFLSTNGGLKDYAKVLDFGLAKVTERELRPGSIMLTQ
ncbi:MAG: serine/threonine protein kinase, partial [Myxococcales bacterium]|nr:serine/threonine protein kinase [Myxococcales bacterium]